jgi:hypothetical protein
MANEFELAMRQAATTVARYVEDVAEMKVITRYVDVAPGGDASFDAAKPIASSTVKIDGDCEAVVPVRVSEGGRYEIDAALLELHQRNVDTAIEYRARILDALLGALPGRGR